MSYCNGLLDKKNRVSWPLGHYIAEIQFQNHVLKWSLNSKQMPYPEGKYHGELCTILIVASGQKLKVAILEIQSAQQNDEVRQEALLIGWYAENMYLDQQKKLLLCLCYLNLLSERLFFIVTTSLGLDIKGSKRPLMNHKM